MQIEIDDDLWQRFIKIPGVDPWDPAGEVSNLIRAEIYADGERLSKERGDDGK